ncbi:MAG TPA: acyl-CoA desaturase, partial [Methylotenera mobilis]|nr:acyl-CoA desaturase [Methylotenera mobilis]
MFNKLLSWFDNHSVQLHADVDAVKNQWLTIDWLRVAPFILMHIACFAVLFVGFSWFALGFALVL